MTDFVSLHNQTDHSILDSICSVENLFKRAKELEQPALAITDHGSFAAAWTALKVSKKIGVKLIIGCEFYFQEQPDDRFRHVILLAMNAVGYRNILTLNKLGFDRSPIGKRVYSVINWELLEKYSEGAICLTACGNGIVSQLITNNRMDDVKETLLRLKSIFGDRLGLEVQPNNMMRGASAYNNQIDQKHLNNRLISLGHEYNIKVVPACNTHYVRQEENETHDVLLAIGSHQTFYSNFRLKYPAPEFYLKSGEEVKKFFARNHGEEYAEEICANTIYFANMCEVPEWIDPKFSNPSGKELPVFPVVDEPDYLDFCEWKKNQIIDVQILEEDKLFLRYRTEFKLNDLIKDMSEQDKQIYRDRIVEELDVLEYRDFSSYMLIVADYINWARKNGIAVGAGRGSVGGCLIAFLLGIHQADPIRYKLIFARFLNRERLAYPDVDSDFAPSGRDKVQQYLKKKYGYDHVAHVSNVNTITPKVYVRDVARVFELGGSRENAVQLGNQVADCISPDIHTIDDALVKSPLFAEYCKTYSEFIKYKDICGKYRAWSTHAGGIIISARPLTGLVPLRKDKDGAWALEYDKDKAEENGLVKIDTLGLSTLDVIGTALELIDKSGKSYPSNMLNYNECDKKTYDLISNGDTFCVFQLGTSGGTIDLCRRIKPESIEDISIINSLARPSARDIRDKFIATRSGKRKFKLLHPWLARAFNGTYGFGLYEESLMYLAQDIAGWSLHEADRLRKLTKEKGKNPKKVELWRTDFINRSVKKGVNETIAIRIFDEIIVPFGAYGFNLAHSTLYSMISYQTAYLKAHYPIQFLLANLMAEVHSNAPTAKSNIEKIKKELRAHKVNIVPPDINRSQQYYTIAHDNQLITGLNALKFVKDEPIKDIINKRPFKDFTDFMIRVDSGKVRSNTIQALAASGALDSFGLSRKSMYLYCSDFRKKLSIWLKKHDPAKDIFIYPWVDEQDWTVPEKYALEQFYLGESFICKPIDAYGKFFYTDHSTVTDIKSAEDRTTLYIKAIVVDLFEFKVKKEGSKYLGQSMVKATIVDKNGDECVCTIFPDRWKTVQDRIKMVNKQLSFCVGMAIQFRGITNSYEDNIGIILDDLIGIYHVPPMPTDLKAKKVNLKALKVKQDTVESQDVSNLLTEIEDSLYDQGLIDLDEEMDD